MRKYIYLIICLMTGTQAYAQNLIYQIKGKVTDTRNNPLENVYITLKGNENIRATTNATGSFTLVVPQPDNTVVIDKTGFRSQEVEVPFSGNENRVTYVNATLESMFNKELEEVIIYDNPSLVTNTKLALQRRMNEIPGGAILTNLNKLKTKRSQTLKDAVGDEPGVIIQDFFGGNDQARLNIRGSGIQSNPQSRGVALLQDGIPVNLADGSYIIGVTEAQAAHLIEIFKGSNGLEYGSSTLGGALNFVTKNGYYASPLNVKLEGGSFGYFNGSISSGFNKGKNDAFVSGSYNRSDGFRIYNSSERYNITANMGRRFTDKLESRLYLNYTDLSFDIPGPLTIAQLLEDPRQINGTPSPKNIGPNVVRDKPNRKSKIFRTGNKNAWKINASSMLEATVYYQYADDVFTFPITNGVRNNPSNDIGAGITYRHHTVTNKFTAGAKVADGVINETYYINQGGKATELFAKNRLKASNQVVYINDVYSISSKVEAVVTIQTSWDARKIIEKKDDPSVRPVFNFMNNTTAMAPSSAVNGSYHFFGFNPKAGLIYSPSGNVQVYANFSRSYEPPTFIELLNLSGGTPNSSAAAIAVADLKAQTASTVELGSRGEIKGLLQWNVSLYNSWLRREILTLTEISGISGQTINSSSPTIHRGIEAAATFTALNSVFSRKDKISLKGVYTYSDFYFTQGSLKDNKVAGIPKHYLIAELKYDHPEGLFVNFNIESLPGKTPMDHNNDLFQPAYALLNARIGYHKNRWGIFVDGRNLANKKYAASYLVRDKAAVPPMPGATAESATNLIPGMGRNFVAGFTFTL